MMLYISHKIALFILTVLLKRRHADILVMYDSLHKDEHEVLAKVLPEDYFREIFLGIFLKDISKGYLEGYFKRYF